MATIRARVRPTVRRSKDSLGAAVLDVAYRKMLRDRAFLEPIRKANAKRIEEKATAHYRNALLEVKSQLRDFTAMPGVGAGGSRTLSFIDGEGERRRLRTIPWAPLSPKYARRRPPSRRFWKKTGKLSGNYNSAVRPRSHRAKVTRGRAVQQTKGGSPKTYYRTTSLRGLIGGKGRTRARAVRRAASHRAAARFRMEHKVSFTPLPSEVMNTLISECFVQGSPVPGQGFKFGDMALTGADIMAYPELARSGRRRNKKGRFMPRTNRPFIAQLSGRLGKHMHTAIRTL
jgi:hypothetical protein